MTGCKHKHIGFLPTTEFPYRLGRLTHVQLLLTRKPSPLQSSNFSFEYLLLPPRSALAAAPSSLTAESSKPPPRSPTRRRIAPWGLVLRRRPAIGSTLQRRPFSGLVDSGATSYS
ncbi:hypothetical protein DPMN_162165 [Dreissena polymorpha]|uniref:Uncharacterized protein n=1 Tax=Dreissena polymorpha TaxID=45954 RepID=A0A9D4ERT0_DREPO|nr:hypothetical protein DPMN_162165 [Dreissena polymorpha]